MLQEALNLALDSLPNFTLWILEDILPYQVTLEMCTGLLVDRIYTLHHLAFSLPQMPVFGQQLCLEEVPDNYHDCNSTCMSHYIWYKTKHGMI